MPVRSGDRKAQHSVLTGRTSDLAADASLRLARLLAIRQHRLHPERELAHPAARPFLVLGDLFRCRPPEIFANRRTGPALPVRQEARARRQARSLEARIGHAGFASLRIGLAGLAAKSVMNAPPGRIAGIAWALAHPQLLEATNIC